MDTGFRIGIRVGVPSWVLILEWMLLYQDWRFNENDNHFSMASHVKGFYMAHGTVPAL